MHLTIYVKLKLRALKGEIEIKNKNMKIHTHMYKKCNFLFLTTIERTTV